ncbi:hypothetical protein H7J51_02075 [Mycobacterium crocinum]|uniref:Uncharacterized protein n=2 Tax=Mycolicibacterium TaxID=1866885 RepID=A0ABX8VQW5_9MYCO|nr:MULTISPECIES: hypothetical protein [Mycolicibacterium]APE14857.1 hypothetical protein BOH72_06145 [Mycobacterium sp. WY10]MCV7214068.1 hypothetical protein [Mycolicibacterium crocinum]QYL20205.1 hypothetical protein K0O64_15675 [Mycolicibacterium pallens]ULN39385.1 hypothetical protein MI149_16630 [Mycolicibacterium crocinum]
MSTPERSEDHGDQQAASEKPVPDDSAKAKAKEMMTAYEDRPTAVLPGSDNTVTGTAVNDWLDEEGQPKFGNDGESGKPS